MAPHLGAITFCRKPLKAYEVLMELESCLEHVIRSGYVVMPCDEAEKFTLGQIQEMIAIARRARDCRS